MTVSLDSEKMTSDQRFHEVATILATGFLRLRYRRGYIPSAPPAAPAPSPAHPRLPSEDASGIPRN